MTELLSDIIDNAGNSSSIWTYYILKDTVINLDSVLNNLNILFDKDRYEATLDRNSEVIKITIPNKVTTDFTTLDALSQQKTVCLEAWWSYNKNEFPEKPNLEPNKNGICEFERDINLITYIFVIGIAINVSSYLNTQEKKEQDNNEHENVQQTTKKAL